MCRAFVGRAVVVSRAKLRFSSVVYLINIDVGSSYNSFGAFYPALISAGAKWHVKLALRHRIKARDNVDARGRQWSRIFFFPAPRRRDFRRNPSFFFFIPAFFSSYADFDFFFFTFCPLIVKSDSLFISKFKCYHAYCTHSFFPKMGIKEISSKLDRIWLKISCIYKSLLQIIRKKKGSKWSLILIIKFK